jgi:ABC-type multidrug transport system permease subunit
MAKIDPALLGKLPKSYLEEDIGHQIIVVAIVFLVLQTIAVSLYYISRRLNKTPNGWEWWLFMPIGYIFSTALCICGICKSLAQHAHFEV